MLCRNQRQGQEYGIISRSHSSSSGCIYYPLCRQKGFLLNALNAPESTEAKLKRLNCCSVRFIYLVRVGDSRSDS